MWARSTEEQARKRHSGFVSFCHRADAATALEQLDEQDPFRNGRRLMVRWGRHMMGDDSNTMPNRSSSNRSHCHDRTSFHLQKRPRSSSHPDSNASTHCLSLKHRSELHNLFHRDLCASRGSIARAMAFCFDQSVCHVEISGQLEKLLLSEDVDWPDTKKAHLFLLSDILFNSQQPGVKNAFRYRDAVERMAPSVFATLGQQSRSRGGRVRHQMTNAVSAVLGAWTNWSVYHPQFLDELHAKFMGKEITTNKTKENETNHRAEGEERREPISSNNSPEHARQKMSSNDAPKPAPRGFDVVEPNPAASQDSMAEKDDDIDGEPLEEGELEEGMDLEEACRYYFQYLHQLSNQRIKREDNIDDAADGKVSLDEDRPKADDLQKKIELEHPEEGEVVLADEDEALP